MTHPADVSVGLDTPATFDAATKGVPTTVQWEISPDGGEEWNEIDEATGDAYTTPPATLGMSGNKYRAVFTSVSPFPEAQRVLTTDDATLTVDAPPVVTVHPPERVRSLVGLDVAMTADADGAQPMTVQWQQSTDGGDTWADIPGAIEKTHVFTAAEELDGALYQAVFTNRSGTATTDTARLEVVLAAPGAHLSVTPAARLVASLGPVGS